MEYDVVKIPNTSEYWQDYEFELYACYYFSWGKNEFESLVVANVKRFLTEYLQLAYKYGVLLPSVIIPDDINVFIAENSSDLPAYWIPFNNIYKVDKANVYATEMYVQRNHIISKELLVNVDPLNRMDELLQNNELDFAPPVSISLYETSRDRMQLQVIIDTDAFFPYVDNKEVDYLIDATELAMLNTPRLNSFLAGLKKLCISFGAEFSYENIWDNDINNPYYFSEDGVLIDGKILTVDDVG